MTGIRVELELDDGSFTTRMMRAGQSIADFERRAGQGIRSLNSLQSSSQSFLGTMRDVTVVLGQASAAISFVRQATTGWVSDIVKVNAEFEKTRKLLEGLSTSSDKVKEAGDNFAYLREQAKTAPYSLAGLTDVFVKLKSAGIDPTKGAMRGLVDAVSSFGGSEEQLKRATLAIQQMSGKGVVQMEELRQQLGEAVPRATELMARSMGVTYSELVKLLATGTVSAKEAIAAMSGEFERTFGGAALAQMSTFNGVVTQISSTFQDLAIKVGEGGGFFTTLTDKARQLNEVLAGRGAGELADKLGYGLTKVLGAIETVVGRLSYFKNEIISVGTVMVAGFGAAKALEALNALATGLSNAGNQVKALYLAWDSWLNNFTRTQAALSGAGASLATFRAGLAATRAAIAATAVALVELAPVLIAVGMGVSFAISYFDLFGKKAKEAREEVEKFGATASKESLKNFVKQIQAEKDELDNLERTKKRVASVGIYVGPGSRNDRLNELTQQIADQREKIAKDEQRAAQISTDYQTNEAQRAAAERLRIFDKNYADQRALFDRYGKEMADKQEAALARAAAAGKSTERLKADYAKAERERQLSIYDLEIANAQSLYEELSKKAEGQKDKELETTNAIIDGLLKRQKAAQDARKQLEAMPMGVTLLAKPIDEDKLYQKGKTALDNLQASIAGVRANLMGASGDVAELQAKLAAGKYGPIDSGRVQELIGQLVEAQAQKSKLDEMMEGRNKFDRDVTNAQIKAERDLFEARNKNISDIDKVIVGYEQGLYKGMGPTQTPMERAVQAARAQLQAATKEAGDTATAVWGKLLSGEGVGGGDQALEKIKELARWMGVVRGDATAITQLNIGAGINVPNSAVSRGGSVTGGASTDPVAKNLPPAALAFLNAISGPESAGRYNIRYTPSGGATFDSYDQHPRIPERTKDGRTSTAAGRYQIVASTWDDIGMGGQSFSPENQDMAAWKLAVRDYARNTGGGDLLKELNENGFSDKIVAALKSTWEGLQSGKGADKARDWYGSTIRRQGGNTVEQDSGYMPVNPEDSRAKIPTTITQDDAEKLAVARAASQLATIETNDAKVKETLQDIINLTAKAEEREEGYGKRVSETRRMIRDGKFGSRDGEKDPESDRYKDLIAAVEKLDKAEEAAARAQQMRQRLKAAGESREKTELELQEREAAIKRRIDEESTYKLPDSVYKMRAEQLRTEARYKELMKTDDSFDQKGLEQLQADNEALFTRMKNVEVASTIQAEQKKTREIERGLMTADQARKAAFDEEIKRLNDMSSQVQGNAELQAQIEKIKADKIIAEQKRIAASSPLGKQMKEWADLGNNMEKAMTGWLDSAADQMATFITTGKADFASLFQSIAKDITKMGIKYLLSQAFGGAGAGGGLKSLLGGGTGGAAKGGAAKGGAGKLAAVGVAHTGAIVGAGFSMSRSINPAIFGSAPRFHTGGIIGHDEVPIIAQRGEGVFTREQMKAMGGAQAGNVITLAPTIQVNATGGTPAQNQDLAEQTAKHAETMMRGLIQKELATQLRPGNMLNQ
jgi:tape measure domain-containing protein